MKVKTFRKLATPLQKDETCKLDMAVLIAFPLVFLVSRPEIECNNSWSCMISFLFLLMN